VVVKLVVVVVVVFVVVVATDVVGFSVGSGTSGHAGS